MNKFVISLILLVGLISCEINQKGHESQKESVEAPEIRFGRKLIERALANSPETHVSTSFTNIKDAETAIKAAEPELFSIYGEKNILAQKPYRTLEIDDYWIISGVLKEGLLGGVFLVILESASGKIISIVHGK